MRSRLLLLLLGITSVVLTLVVLELGLRIASKGSGFIAAWQTENRFELDRHLVYRLKPGITSSRQTGEYLETVTINPQGFRSTTPTATSKAPHTYRILLMGDSFTFGHGLKDAQTIAAHMEAQLNASESGVRVEVLNHGTPGYSPDQEYLVLLNDIETFHPDLIFWNLIPLDMDDTIAPGPNYRASLFDVSQDKSLRPLDATKNQIYIRNVLLTRTPKPIRATRLFTVLMNAFSRLPLFLSIPHRSHEKLREWATEKTIQEAASIDQKCKPPQCTLVVSWFPAPLTESTRRAIPFPETALRALGINTVNVARILGNHPDYFYPLDKHPNPMGAASIAGVLSDQARSFLAVPHDTASSTQ